MKLFVATKAVIVNESQQVLLLRQGSEYAGKDGGIWDVPGGRIEAGEYLLDALKREVLEETGIDITNSATPTVFHVYDKISLLSENKEESHIVRIYYHVSVGAASVTLSPDHDQSAWVSRDMLENYHIYNDVLEAIEKCFQDMRVSLK
jgi:8-oxo-dGTP pyrophosphatase MutT (NUDIX family)